MAKIIKRGDEYFVQFYGNGLLFEKYAGKDKERAQKLLLEIESSLPQGAMSNVIPDQDIGIFFNQFLQEAQRNHPPATFEHFKKAIERFGKFLKEKLPRETKLSRITPNVAEQYRDCLREKGEGPPEVNFQLFLLQCVLDFAIKKSYLNDNPLLHVKALALKAPAVMAEKELREYQRVANSKEQLVLRYLIGEAMLDERFKLLKWSDFKDERLRNAFIKKLLDSHVPLVKIYEIFRPDDIEQLKAYTGWVRTKV
ncbi:MAG TPA: phage integrase SAM-like domain-containing protein [Candidatus Omnitrophota bacterium]|nr:phage integrase SAM-like domain-containing protein [Candidatus Omnitrophota bacterium]